MARLVIFDERVRGVDLGGHPVILGRSRRADILIRDRLLSRKHCTIVPVSPEGSSGGYRLIDLKSSNGTFLNGVRVERQDLKTDDIIEIGNTVMVLLDTDTWKRGKGLPRLRNPAKAKELIKAIKKREVLKEDLRRSALAGGGEARAAPILRQRRSLTAAESEFIDWARREWLQKPAAKRLLEDYMAYQLVSIILRHTPELARPLSAAMEKLLRKEIFEGDWTHLQGEMEKALEAVLSGAPPIEDPGGAPGTGAAATSDGEAPGGAAQKAPPVPEQSAQAPEMSEDPR